MILEIKEEAQLQRKQIKETILKDFMPTCIKT